MTEQLSGFLPTTLMTGEPEVDAQHEAIFRRVEHLQKLAVESNAVPVAELHELLDYLAEHFATEERLAKEANIEFLVHGQEHASNYRLINKAIGELEKDKLDRHTFLRYIEYWFEQHITNFDKRFVERLKDARKRS